MMKIDLSLICHARRSESGSASIEFAFIGILLIILTLGTFELGRFAYVSHGLTHAISFATRLVGMGATEDQIIAGIRNRLPPDQQANLTVAVVQQDIDGLPYVRIDAQVALPLIIPRLGLFDGAVGDTMTVRAVHLVPPAPPNF